MVAVRQGRERIGEAEVFEALEKIHRDRMGRGGDEAINFDADNIPPAMLRTIAVYEAARALVRGSEGRADRASAVLESCTFATCLPCLTCDCTCLPPPQKNKNK